MPDPNALVTLEDVLPHLNMSEMPPDGGAKLQGFIDAATPVIEDICGHILQLTITNEIHDGGDISLNLRHVPVQSIQSITEVIGIVPYVLTQQLVGQPVDNYGYTMDLDADGMSHSGRVVRRSAGSIPMAFFPNRGNISVNYTAGRPTVPSNIRLAALEQIRHMYQWGQQGTRPVYGEPADMVETPSGYLVPNRVMELCQVLPRFTTFA